MGYSCEYHRTTKAQIDAYVKSINPNYAEVVGVTGAWVKFIVKLTNKPCADLLLMHKDKEGYVWYKAISASSGPNVTNQSVARWLRKEYAARGLTPSDDLKQWLDYCDKKAAEAKAQKDKLAAFAKSLEVGKRYPVKHEFQAGPYKFKVGDEFIYWGTLPKSKKRLSFHHDNIPVNFLLTADIFIE